MGMADGFNEVFEQALSEGNTVVEDAPATPAEEPAATPTSEPAPPEPPKDTAPEPVATEPKAPTIDSMGRYHRPDGTVMTKAEVETYKASQTPAPAEPVAAPEPVVEAPPPANPNVPYIPEGHSKPLFEGALKSPTGDLFIPAAQVDQAERAIMRGLRYDQFREDKRQAVIARERSQAEQKVMEDVLVRHFATPDALTNLVAAVQQYGPELVQREIGMALREGNLSINQKFAQPVSMNGPVSEAPRPEAGHATPLDPEDAQETFADYWREQLARPEFKGMPEEMKQSVRASLNHLPLFVSGPDGHYLNEAVAEPVWQMARQAMQRAAKAVEATQFNTRQAAKGAGTTPAPPTVTTRTTGTKGNATPTSERPKDPQIDPKTGKPYDNPWDAILRA